MFAIDATRESCVIICRDCDRRFVTRDRLAGWRLAAEHERVAHPGQLHAAIRFAQQTRRATSKE